MANKTITQLDAAQSLNDNMVIAVQDTNTTYKTTLADVKAYCGAAPETLDVLLSLDACVTGGTEMTEAQLATAMETGLSSVLNASS